LIESVRLFVTLLCFGYAAVMDYKFREVENWVWILFGSVGVALLLLMPFAIPIWSILAACVFAFPFWYFGGFGGADAKAIITLSLLMPTGFNDNTPYFPLVSLAFAVVLANLPVAYAVIKHQSLKKLKIPLLVYLFAGILVSLFVGQWFIELIL